MAQPLFEHIAVLGVGLLGGSFALAAKERGISSHITGYGRTRETLRKALERGIIDAAADDPASACRNADLVLVAVPVGSFLELTAQFKGGLKKGAIVTDVGSVKGVLVSGMEQAMPEGVRFVGGHPIAGSDRSGIEYAEAGLFRGARCILTPTGWTDPHALDAVEGLWKALGANVARMSPEEHDRIYAAVSHLPHLVAYAIMNSVAGTDPAHLGYAGNGFRDLTRIAASSPELWADILLMNRTDVLAQMEAFEKEAASLKAMIEQGDREGLIRSLRNAQALRENLGKH